jgi:hypothetical protein
VRVRSSRDPTARARGAGCAPQPIVRHQEHFIPRRRQVPSVRRRIIRGPRQVIGDLQHFVRGRLLALRDRQRIPGGRAPANRDRRPTLRDAIQVSRYALQVSRDPLLACRDYLLASSVGIQVIRDPLRVVCGAPQVCRGHQPIPGAHSRIVREHLGDCRDRLRIPRPCLPTSSNHRMIPCGHRMIYRGSPIPFRGRRMTLRRRLPSFRQPHWTLPHVSLERSCRRASRRDSRHAPGGRLRPLRAPLEARRLPPPSRPRSLLTIRTTTPA